MNCNFDREAVIRMIMAQADSYFTNLKQYGSVMSHGALVGIRSCLLFMDATDEAARVTAMIERSFDFREQARLPKEGGNNGGIT